MATLTVELTCIRCNHTWYQDLSKLNRHDIVYRGAKREEQYSVPCPKCGTYNVVTVAIEDDDA